MRKLYLLFLLTIVGLSQLNAQTSFGIGTDTPDANAIFDAQSTNKGILIPRLTTAQRNAITGLTVAQEGLLIYNTITDEFNYWDGGAWVAFPNAGANNTLDQAYDEGGAGAGRQIDASDGAVRVNGRDGLIVTGGAIGSGDAIEVTGAGTRMFFNPRTAAFRAGGASGTEWNPANIGNYSAALGREITASGDYSMAFGYTGTASGDYSVIGGFSNDATSLATTAFGYNNTVSGQYSTAVGRNNNVTGQYNFVAGDNNTAGGNFAIGVGQDLAVGGAHSAAFGNSNQANGAYSFAIGLINNATGSNSFVGGQGSAASASFAFAYGEDATASNTYTFAFGNEATASGNGAAAIGYTNTASGTSSFAINASNTASGASSFAGGSQTIASGDESVSFGDNAIAASAYEFVIGRRPTTYAINSATAMNINDRAFAIGNATTATRSNAFEVWKDGRVIINEQYTLPNVDGATNYIMQTDGSGNVSWVNPSTLATATEWTDVGASIHPADGITEEVTIGTLTAANAKLTIDANDRANGINVSKTSSSPSPQVGVDIDLDNGAGGGGTTGINNVLTGTGGNLRYGVRTDISGSTSAGTTGHYGARNTVSSSGFGARYGVANEISGTGTGRKYGTYNVIENTSGGTSHRAVYGEALKAGSNIFAGYFLGNVGIGTTTTNIYTLPASRGTNGDIMQTDGSGNVSWVDPSTISSGDADWFVYGTTNAPTSINDNIYTQGNVGIGTSTPVYDLHITPGASTGLYLSASGATFNYSMIVHNTVGRAARFQTGGTISGYTSANVAIDAHAFGAGAIAGVFRSHDSGTGVQGISEGTGAAVEGWAQGSGNAGYFRGGEVLISDGLESNNGAVFNENSSIVDFRVEGNTQPHLLFVDGSTDRVGIGTSAPANRFQVEGGAVFNETSADADFRIEGSTDANLFFIDASEDNIGIGTATPSIGSKINIVSSDFFTGLDIDLASNSFNVYQGITLNVNNSYNVGITSTYGMLAQTRTTNTYSNAGNISGLYSAAQDYQSNATATDQRTIIGVSGNSYVSYNTGISNSRGIYGSTSGVGDYEYGGYFVGDVYCSGTYLPSDIHLKQNVAQYSGAIAQIEALNPVTYQYKNERYPLLNLPEGPQIGLIAQEVEKVFPNMVKRADEGPQRMPIEQAKELGLEYRDLNKENGTVEVGEQVEILAINYTNLVPVLIKAMQEQQATIEQLEQRISDLEK